MQKKKLKFPRELSYVLGILIMTFAVALTEKANLGMSMIAAPCYIISQKIPFLSYGQTEYIFQTLVLLLMCIIIRKFRITYLLSFVTAIIYGTALDFFGSVLDVSNPATVLWQRVLFFVVGTVLTSIAVAFFFHTYFAPCAYDFFVRKVTDEKGIDRRKFKVGFDCTCLVVSTFLTLVLFRGFVGVSLGTVIIAVVNGNLINFFGHLMEKHLNFYDLFPIADKIDN